MSLLISHPIGSSLLRAVCVAPNDDTPRLVLADWLEENGEALRAEFIRVQCELAHTRPWLWDQCKVCEATPDDEGCINHGKGCYVESEDGGGTSYAGPDPRYEWLVVREKQILASLFPTDPAYPSGPTAWDFLDGGPMFPSGTMVHPHMNSLGITDLVTVYPPRDVVGFRLTFKRGLASAFSGPSKVWKEYGRMLVGLYPLEEVTLTDKEPRNYSPEQSVSYQFGEWSWWMYVGEPEETPADIRAEEFSCLAAAEPVGYRHCRDYPTKEAALKDLSDACLKVARKQAGLPPL